MKPLKSGKPHIISRDDFKYFTLTQVLASDSDAGKRLTAVFDVGDLTHRFDFYRWNGKKYQYERSFQDLDQAIAFYNEI